MDFPGSPDEPSHPAPPRPAWQQPMFVLPATVAVDLLVIRTAQVAVTVGPIRAYATGFEFTVDAHMRRNTDPGARARRRLRTGDRRLST